MVLDTRIPGSTRVPKPRRTIGTPAYKASNYFAFGVLAVGAVLGVIYHFSPPAQKLKLDISKGKFKLTEEQIDRKKLMDVVARKRGETIAKMSEERKDAETH